MKVYTLILSVIIFPFTLSTLYAQEEIDWHSIEAVDELIASNNGKLFFIDVYTDWCGWCKRMDATTFSNPEVAKVMNKHFHAIKLDGEDKDTITVRGQEFKFVPSSKRGYNELPARLLQGKLSYPTVVFLDENFNMLQPLPGYRTPEQLIPILKYLGEKHFRKQSFEDFMESYTD